ncbi:hypothetical protein K435DRAFT_821522 [Dendrothele bispora CBS 962.96]|uniref:Glycoside hydrolase n=1 Tax=Dendrothele bispora (strain CBS 962.96) TaxID=1314807 RepID=A0A4S8LIP0_DENBC|nr:hypothetical protein K435DRAFT_821522 [Dendrothele bispora CBS 962.96]
MTKLTGCVVGAVFLAVGVVAQDNTWCGKHYMSTDPVVSPGGNFPIASTSPSPLLAIRCGAAVKPYLPEDVESSDDATFVSILVDTPITNRNITGATPVTLPSSSDAVLSVTVSVDGKTLASGDVPLNASKHSLPFNLSSLEPRVEAYTITCDATLPDGQKFNGTNLLTFLPTPPADIGSVTKMDMRTGGLLARPANGSEGPYERVMPIGFYTQYGDYLSQDLSIPATLKEQGSRTHRQDQIHPVPPFDNETVLNQVLDAMQEAGLYIMYDMRGTYMNDTSVTSQVNLLKQRPNLLLWYTADEPDGTSDALTATPHAKNLINSLDGGDGKGGAGYHPVSLVLNCENYFFTEYSEGADILLQDTYTVGNNLSFSSVWGTVCTDDYGDCGCDNCHLGFEDIIVRMDEFADRIFFNGWELDKVVWAVPQAFGNESYWTRYPTGKEVNVQSVIGINHGGVGVVPWDDTKVIPSDIKNSFSDLALSLPSIIPFILEPGVEHSQFTTALTVNSSSSSTSKVDIGAWKAGSKTLVLLTNMGYESGSVAFDELGLGDGEGVMEQVFKSGASVGEDGKSIVFEEVGSGGFVFTTSDTV